jgi:hypothetical protein
MREEMNIKIPGLMNMRIELDFGLLPEPREYAKAIESLIKMGDLKVVEHGYCPDCGQEKQVLEPNDDYPEQPPICAQCYLIILMAIGQAQATLKGRS